VFSHGYSHVCAFHQFLKSLPERTGNCVARKPMEIYILPKCVLFGLCKLSNFSPFVPKSAERFSALVEHFCFGGICVAIVVERVGDRKARAASAQSFTLWQQATMEITCHDHPIIACSRHVYMGVVLRTHPVRGECTFNATPTERLQ